MRADNQFVKRVSFVSVSRRAIGWPETINLRFSIGPVRERINEERGRAGRDWLVKLGETSHQRL